MDLAVDAAKKVSEKPFNLSGRWVEGEHAGIGKGAMEYYHRIM